MRKPGTINEVIFNVGSLTANSNGLFSVYSNETINGTIQNIQVGSNNFTNTGSLLFYESGTTNGVNDNDLILRLRAGSQIQTFYPFVYAFNNQLGTGSPQIATQRVLNGSLRVVGSGLGDSKSGLGITIRYI